MKLSGFAHLCLLFIGITLIASPVQAAHTQGTNASGVLGQLSEAFSGNHAVQSVQLSGAATWYAGSLEDSGTVNLTATSDGSSQMQLRLGASGQRTEAQVGVGLTATCQWTGDDGLTHEIRSGSCWRPLLWFLPSLSLQSSLTPIDHRVVDLGIGAVGTSERSWHHLQSQLTLSKASEHIARMVAESSKSDIGLDPVTNLPVVVAYSVRPDNGAPKAIAIEIHYSDYRAVNGVQIPFHIQRFVNGSLQLDILISSAEIN